MNKKWVLAGVALYLVFLIGTAPANMLVPLLQSQMRELRLSSVSGTIWSGSANQVYVKPVQFMEVDWRFRPFALLLGRLEISVSGQMQGQAVVAKVGRSVLGEPYLSDVQGRVAASDLLAWRQIRQVAVDGYLDFNLQKVRLSETGVPALAGTVNWSPARVTRPLQLELGKAQLDTGIEDDATRGNLQVSGGALLLQGDVELKADGAYRLDAKIRQNGQVPQAVSKFLSTFAEYRDGEYRLEWSDTL